MRFTGGTNSQTFSSLSKQAYDMALSHGEDGICAESISASTSYLPIKSALRDLLLGFSVVCISFLLFKSLGNAAGLFSSPREFRGGCSGLDRIPFRLLAGAVISYNACLAELVRIDPCERGVKNRVNFLGVTEGLRLSFRPSRPYVEGLGGERWEMEFCFSGGGSWGDFGAEGSAVEGDGDISTNKA